MIQQELKGYQNDIMNGIELNKIFLFNHHIFINYQENEY